MMKHINNATYSHKFVSLPYEMLLTKFSVHFIDLENEESEDVIATLKGRASKSSAQKKSGNKDNAFRKGKIVVVENSRESKENHNIPSLTRKKKKSNISKKKKSNQLKNL